ncbi:MAG: PD-(D/E)XK nuclease family protein, partial [Clostridia bacterium]|nr:PD-(D/E)XK nuclease family protein [Clostridia bacterium]
FNKKISRSKTGKDYARALFELLEDINIAEGIESEIYNLENENRIDEAQQYERIWELLLEVIDQIVITMGDEEMSIEEFGEYIKEGISTCEIRLVPSGIDRVYVGSADKNTVVDVKVLFAMGAIEGTYPNISKTEGFLTDDERETLNNSRQRKMFADTVKERIQKQNYAIFELFAQVSDYLFISMPLFDFSGAEHGESSIVTEIKRKFPNVKISNNFSYSNSEEKFYISSPEATFHKLLINKSQNRTSSSQIWDAVKEYYALNDKYASRLQLLDEDNEFFKVEENIDSEWARKLYGDKINYSKSKINEYAMCPYRFFLNYGLGIKEREEWEISKADLGSYAHEIIEKFCTRVEDGAVTSEEKLNKWRELGEDGRKRILNEIFNKVSERMQSTSLTRQAKIEHILSRMNRVIDKATKSVTNCFVHGKYTIKGMEKEITVPISDEVFINGFIDRLDELKEDGKNSIRVVDYKTGASEFNIKNIYNGVDMQMVIYALAAKLKCEEEEQIPYTVTGMYYTKLRGELKRELSEVDKLKKLDGVTFENNDNFDDGKVLFDMDNETKNGISTVLPIKFTKNGSLDKKSTEKVRTQYEGEKLMEFVRDKILEFDDNIRNKGDIRIMPYEKACDYCNYSNICQISDCINQRPQEGKDLKADEIWKAIVAKQEEKE